MPTFEERPSEIDAIQIPTLGPNDDPNVWPDMPQWWVKQWAADNIYPSYTEDDEWVFSIVTMYGRFYAGSQDWICHQNGVIWVTQNADFTKRYRKVAEHG